ncbi:TetR/AcrR family transcriptional regulator, partial [Ralstonia pseudosolanacearum]
KTATKKAASAKKPASSKKAAAATPADDDSDNVDGSSTAPQATPSARTRALAIRRSNAARAIFPANPMRPWRSPGA